VERVYPLKGTKVRIPSHSLRSGTGSTLGLRPRYALTALSAARKFNLPFSKWREVFLIFYLLSFKKIVLYYLVKVDGQMSRSSRDKCPVHTESIPLIKIEDRFTNFLLGKICRLPLFASCCRYSTDSIRIQRAETACKECSELHVDFR
jgi:hypothetical protein